MSPTLIHCSLCGFVVSKQFSLSSHISSKHFQCLICGNVFGSTLELNSHKKSEHHENCGGNICVSKSSTVEPGHVFEKDDESKVIETKVSYRIKEVPPEICNSYVLPNLAHPLKTAHTLNSMKILDYTIS